MKRKRAQKRNAPLPQDKSDWHFDHVVEAATAAQMDRILDAFIDAVEKEGLYCGGGLHPLGRCASCRDDDEPSTMKGRKSQRRRRVLVEARKLDPRQERALAEEGMTGEESAWPAY